MSRVQADDVLGVALCSTDDHFDRETPLELVVKQNHPTRVTSPLDYDVTSRNRLFLKKDLELIY